MPAPLVKTNERGIYKRGNRYAVIYRDHEGRQRQESARTLDDARRLKRARQTAADQGEAIAPARLTVAEYARTWIDGYPRPRSVSASDTRRVPPRPRALRDPVPRLRAFGELRRTDVREFVAWLVDDKAQAKRHAEENARARPPASGRSGRPARCATRPCRGSWPWKASARPSMTSCAATIRRPAWSFPDATRSPISTATATSTSRRLRALSSRWCSRSSTPTGGRCSACWPALGCGSARRSRSTSSTCASTGHARTCACGGP